MKNEIILPLQQITNYIFTIRGEKVMIDSNLAEMYQVDIKRLNEQVKRNKERFPVNFMFQLSVDEWNDLKSQIATSSSEHGGRRYLPYAFTEQGVAMLSSVLRSDVAVRVSIQIMNAFVQIRKLIGQETIQLLRISNIENKLIEYDQKFNLLFRALEKNELPQKGIFFNGQVFDAYTFAADLIRKADSSLILIDNYIDDTVFSLLNKRKKGVSCRCYTKNINKTLQLDLHKHNQQYALIEIFEFRNSHDRFLIIDEKELFHIGASLKDLGKKWFAFSKMEWGVENLLRELRV